MYVESPGSQPSSSPRVGSVNSGKVGHIQHRQMLVGETESPPKKPRIEGQSRVHDLFQYDKMFWM